MKRSPGRSVGTKCCSTQVWKERWLIGQSNTRGALNPSRRRSARKVTVRQRPCGAMPFRRCPFGAQPRSGAVLVLILVSFHEHQSGWIQPVPQRPPPRPWPH